MGKRTDAGVAWCRAANVACVDSDTHVALLPLAHTPAGSPRILEGPAAVIWRELDTDARPETDIIADVAKAFGESPASVADDVRAFLRELEGQGLAQELS